MSEKGFSLVEARELVADLLEPDFRVYWADFLLSAAAGWALYALALRAGFGSATWLALFVPSMILLFRCLVFVHPIYHLPRGQRRAMSIAYNLAVGVPFLFPFFFYEGSHSVHHHRAKFGTGGDPEYRPFASSHPAAIVGILLLTWLSPVALWIRFALIGPVSYLHPRLRAWVKRNASASSMVPGFERVIKGGAHERGWLWQEGLSSAFALALPALYLHGHVSGGAVGQWLLAGSVVACMNGFQFLALHRYESRGESSTLEEQILDSCTTPGRIPFITALWAPAGQRFHALHHIFPQMPYHRMPEAHRRLMAGLPARSPYRATVNRSYASAFARLWRSAVRREEEAPC